MVITQEKAIKVNEAIERIKQSLDAADSFTQQAKIAHANTLDLVQAEGIEWKNITRYLQLVVYAGEYPLQDGKEGRPEKKDGEGNFKPLSMKDARNTSDAGRKINCFNSHPVRSAMSDYGVKRQTIEPVVQPVKVTAVETDQVKAIRAEHEEITAKLQGEIDASALRLDTLKEESKNSKPIVANKEAIPAFLMFLFQDTKGNEQVQDSVTILADYYNVKL